MEMNQQNKINILGNWLLLTSNDSSSNFINVFRVSREANRAVGKSKEKAE